MIRIDDYPTGIRPIQEGQLELFDKMLAIMPTVHLGIVPKLFKNFKCELNHPNVVPCMHGVDHCFYDYSHLLKNDPYNLKTVGVFDEFEDWEYEDIPYAIDWGKKYLESYFGQSVDHYIPPCNVIDRNLANILYGSGFKYILSENTCPSPIPIIKSDYYGKLDDMNLKSAYKVITLHMTWEMDTILEKGFDYWAKKVYQLRFHYGI